MNKKEAKETFYKLRSEYNEIAYPKYLHADVEDLQNKYNVLKEMEEFLKDDFSYARLVNAISQTIARLSIKATRSNTSERGMNKAIPPVIRRGSKEFVLYEWESDKSGNVCSIIGDWDARSYMVMDVVGHFFLLKENGDIIPDEIAPIFSDYDSIRRREQEIGSSNIGRRNQAPMIITEEDLPALKQHTYVKFDDRHFRDFTGLKLCSNDIFNLLEKTSRVEFRVEFPVRMVSDKGWSMKEKWYSMNVFSRPFELGYIDKEVRKDGIVQNRYYYIFFNTILGEMFVHNLLTKNYDWIDNNLYHLPQSAQIFYRHLLLHHNLTEQEFNLSTIIERMRFKDTNMTNLISNLEINTLNPLKKCGLILSFKQTKGTNGLKYRIALPKKGRNDSRHPQTDKASISEEDVGSGK